MENQVMSPGELADAWSPEASLMLAGELMSDVAHLDKSARDGFWSATKDALDALIAAHPAAADDSGFHAAFARLSRAPDRDNIRNLIEMVDARRAELKRTHGPHHSNPWTRIRSRVDDLFAFWRGRGKPERLRPVRLSHPNPWLAQITVAEARAALQRTTSGFAKNPAYRPDRDDALKLTAAVERWRKITLAPGILLFGLYKYGAPCHRCREGWVSPLRPDEHLLTCPGHPAWARLDAARTVVRVGELLIRSAQFDARQVKMPIAPAAAEPSPHWINASKGEDALQALLSGHRQPDADAISPARVLDAVLVEWERALDLKAIPCRMCGAAQAIYSLESHLTACAAHPADRAAEQLLENFRCAAGPAADVVIASVTNHQSKLNALRVLSKACEQYNSNLGWSGEGGAYSERSSEEPWSAAIREAESAVSIARAAGRVEDARAAEVLTQLAAEAQRLGSALERLLASSRGFGAALGDGPDIDKDYVNEAADRTWTRARKDAIAALQAYDRDNVLSRLGADMHA